MKDMDLSIALSHVDGDRKLLAELADLFLKDYARLLEEIRDSIAKGDSGGLERGAHTLKGRLAFFGVQRVCEMALALEIKGRTKDMAGALQSLQTIDREMANISPEFEKLAREHTA